MSDSTPPPVPPPSGVDSADKFIEPSAQRVAPTPTNTQGHTKPSDMTDFSDKFSPMLVKELRQGMRTNLFTIAFVLLQGFMVICVLMGASDPQGSSEVVTGFFWFFLSVTLFIIMPMRGFSALSSEIKLDTLDLIQLTKLGALRIIVGKWAALVAQTSLFVASILPYVVMRYFFGGVNILVECALIFCAFLLSCVFTALMVGFSAFNSVVIRMITLVTLIGFGWALIISSLSMVYRGVPSFGGELWWGVAAGFVTALFAIYFFLDLGASRIAPESANHSTRKRLVGIGFVLTMFGMSIAGANEEMCLVFAIVAGTLIVMDAITEPPTMVPSVYRPFSPNPLKRLAAYFLAPGWHTAIGFVLVMSALFFGYIAMYDGQLDLSDKDVLLGISSFIGSLLFPVLVIQLFFNPVSYSKFHFGLYLLTQLCVSALTMFIYAVANSSSFGDIIYQCFPIPQVCLVVAGDGSGGKSYFQIANLIFIAITLCVWLVRAVPLIRRSRDTMKMIQSGASTDEIPSERLIVSQ